MLSKLFYTPVLRGRIEPSKQQLDETNAVLDAYWEKAEEGIVMRETGRSTASVAGGKCLWDHTELDWFLNPVMIAAHGYWKHTLQLRKDWHVYVDSMWANKHWDNDTTGEHCHISGGRSKSHVSIVYYLDKSHEGGHLQFKNPLEDIIRMTPLDKEYDDWTGDGGGFDWHTESAESFDYMIFPSWLKHRTQPAVGRRIAISINVAGTPIDPTEGDYE